MSNADNKITCQICGSREHAIQAHLPKLHPEWTLERYKQAYPEAPLLSPYAEEQLNKRRAEMAAGKVPTTPMPASGPTPGAAAPAAAPTSAATIIQSAVTVQPGARVKKPFHEVFKLGAVKAALSSKGDPIPISVLTPHEHQDMVPAEDENYIFNIDLLKTCLMGLELNIPSYLWGHAGTGKTTMWEQISHYLNMPAIRVQHTLNMEEAHVIGQTLANEKGTYFEPGPLPMAMRNGWTYVADEYDRAVPGVLSCYQPVLEGKPLIIKEAPPEWRVVKPHPNFRFVATGNSNGSGDETGLYQSTLTQDASNYSRFGIVEKVNYMPQDQERAILMGKTGIAKEDAQRLVQFATDVRKQYDARQLTNPIGPRELLYAATLGARRADFRWGIKVAFSNKLPQRSQLAVDQFAQRIFGGT
jgi:cobaltochelatase CobS